MRFAAQNVVLRQTFFAHAGPKIRCQKSLPEATPASTPERRRLTKSLPEISNKNFVGNALRHLVLRPVRRLLPRQLRLHNVQRRLRLKVKQPLKKRQGRKLDKPLLPPPCRKQRRVVKRPFVPLRLQPRRVLRPQRELNAALRQLVKKINARIRTQKAAAQRGAGKPVRNGVNALRHDVPPPPPLNAERAKLRRHGRTPHRVKRLVRPHNRQLVNGVLYQPDTPP